MINFVAAVRVSATATIDTIDTHLIRPMRYLMPGVARITPVAVPDTTPPYGPSQAREPQ